MKSFWLFRTNLRQLEYYHSIRDLETFKKECHDFYLLMGIWFLENNIVDEVVVWRLQSKVKVKDIVFEVSGKKFVQKFVDDFSVCLSFPKPFVVLWRGGFEEYDNLTLKNPEFFSPRSFYLAAGRRTFPLYGGKYDRILIETDSDLQKGTWPFYKTANSEIFRPLNLQKKYDICWICNFSQTKFKGQDFFIPEISKSKFLKGLSEISKSKFLKGLSICHIGNNPEVGIKMCSKNKISNIQFVGHLTRSRINEILNESKFGLVTSNSNDGCPRVITEVMMSGTPLLIRSQTKILNYYKRFGVVVFDDNEIEEKFEKAFKIIDLLKSETKINVSNLLTMKTICEKNLELWLSKN